MSVERSPEERLTLIAASVPGGMARQYRVQYHSASQAQWRLYRCFRSELQAAECLRGLEQQGRKARLVKYRSCPAAP